MDIQFYVKLLGKKIDSILICEMNLYENISDLLWEHWVNVEMNMMSVEYTKMF
jgi:hypothetical protein